MNQATTMICRSNSSCFRGGLVGRLRWISTGSEPTGQTPELNWHERRSSRDKELSGSRSDFDLKRQRHEQGTQHSIREHWTDNRRLTKEVSKLGRERRWEEALHAFAQEPNPNPLLRVAAMDACSRSFQRGHVWTIFKQMPEKIASAYNILISMEGRSRQIQMVERLLQDMQESCIKPDVMTLTSVINAYGMVHNVTGALGILDGMESRNIAPDRVAYGATMAACARAGDKANVRSILKRMDTMNLKVDITQLTCLIASCTQSRDEEGGRAGIAEMRRRGFFPDKIAYTALLGCLSGKDVLVKAEEVLKEMRGDSIQIDTFVLNAVLRHAAELGDKSSFDAILRDIDAFGLQRSRETHYNASILQKSLDALRETTVPVQTTMPVETTLPAGWSQAVDPGTGQTYYWKDVDPGNTTTWSRPQ